MARHTYERAKRVELKYHADYSESWVQAIIAEDPSVLGLGDLLLKDKERRQSTNGKLDFLFEDADGNERYEVEVQLGSTDPSHIVRTLEYWDIERNRYQDLSHTAVLIAEDIPSRFLDVVSLFNGHIPIIAIQMTAIEVDDKISLVFTKVLDKTSLGVVEDDEPQTPVDRAHWETKRGTPETVAMVDSMLEIIHEFDDRISLSYNRPYIGLYRDQSPCNFALFNPQKRRGMAVRVRIPQSDELEEELQLAEIEIIKYNSRRGEYKIRLTPSAIDENRELLQIMLQKAHVHYLS